MSNKSIISTIVVVLVVVAGTLLLTHHSTAPGVPVATTTPASTTPTVTNTQSITTSGDNSNAALAQDMSGVDTQMTGLSSDSANADQGLNNPNQ